MLPVRRADVQMRAGRQPSKLLIIGRDPHDCDRVREWLAESASVAVAADCLSIAEAVVPIQRHEPDLLMIDVRLLAPAAIRRLSYSSALPMLLFLNPAAEECRADGCERVPNVTFADRRLFCRQVELAAGLLPPVRPVSIPRLLFLLTNRAIRYRRSTHRPVEHDLRSINPQQVAWMAASPRRTMLHGGETPAIALPLADVVRDFKRRGAHFALVSEGVAVNLERVVGVRVTSRGNRAVVL